MRRYVPILLVLALSLLAGGVLSCQGSPRDGIPLRPYDLAPAVLDLSVNADLVPPPDLASPDGGAADGGAVDGATGG